MSVIEIISGIIIAIASGGLGAYFTYRSTKARIQVDQKKIDLDSEMIHVKMLVEENERARKENLSLRSKQDEMILQIDALKDGNLIRDKRINELELELSIFKSAHMDNPFPQCLKDTHGVIKNINPSYENKFLKPLGRTAREYIGKTDIEFWGEEIGRRYYENTMLTIATKRAHAGREPLKKQNGISECIFYKAPQYIGPMLIGEISIFIDIDDIKEV